METGMIIEILTTSSLCPSRQGRDFRMDTNHAANTPCSVTSGPDITFSS